MKYGNDTAVIIPADRHSVKNSDAPKTSLFNLSRYGVVFLLYPKDDQCLDVADSPISRTIFLTLGGDDEIGADWK